MIKTIQILGHGATARLAALALHESLHEFAGGRESYEISWRATDEAKRDGPVLALNLATLDFLDQFGIAPSGCPVDRVGIYAANDRPHIWTPGLIVSGEDVAASSLGRIVWQKDLLAALDEALRARHIDSSQQAIKADLTICTDQSHLYQPRSYGQTALTGLLSHLGPLGPHKNMAAQFFFPSGPLALLPLSDQQSVFIWTRRDKTAKNLLSLEKEKFLLFLCHHLPAAWQEVELAGNVEAHQLKFFFSSDWVQKDRLLIGEAAHQLHPLAGQGWNVCVEDVRLLAEMASEAIYLGLPAFSSVMLADYQKSRRAHAGALARAVDLLARIPFLSSSAAAACLDALALSKKLRRFFTHAGAGRLSSLRASSAKRTGTPSRTG